MQKLKQTLVGLSLLVFSSMNVAQAEAFDLGTISSDQVYTITNTVGFEPGRWSDTITFSLDNDTYLETAFYSLSFQTMGAVDNFLVDLFNTDTGVSVFNSSPLSQVENFTFGLDAGNYQFNLTGSGNDGALPGVYTMAVSPVPEASVYSLMLTGLAFLGLTLRRRKSK